MRQRKAFQGVLVCFLVLAVFWWTWNTSSKQAILTDLEKGTARKESRQTLPAAAASDKSTRDVVHMVVDRKHSPSQSSRRRKLAVVSGLSENHVLESVDMIASVQRYSPSTPILVYDLGITSSLQMLKSFCNVSVRTFPFDQYPGHVHNLEACAWKPFIVQEVLQEFGTVLYLDASIRFKKNIANMLRLLDTANPVIGQSTAPSGPAGSYTHNATLEYFNISRDQYRDVDMFAATWILMKRTPIVEAVVREWVQCAIVDSCISPHGSKKWPCLTALQKEDRNAFIGCHRYDQSALSIILFKLFGRDRYSMCIQDSASAAVVQIARYKTSFINVTTCQT